MPGHRWEAVRVQVHEQQRQPKRKEQDRVEHDTQRDEENKGVRKRVLVERCILRRHASLFFHSPYIRDFQNRSEDRRGEDGGQVVAKARDRAGPLAPQRHDGPHRRQRVAPLRVGT